MSGDKLKHILAFLIVVFCGAMAWSTRHELSTGRMIFYGLPAAFGLAMIYGLQVFKGWIAAVGDYLPWRKGPKL